MSTKYVLDPYTTEAKIHACECIKETKEFVWVKGLFPSIPSHVSRRSKEINVFDTWAEAHAELTRRAETGLSQARRQLELAQGFAGNVRGMKPPQEVQ